MVVILDEATLAASGSAQTKTRGEPMQLIYTNFEDELLLTFIVVHVRASNLVHQQHEDEAQHQRDADACVELLVAVLVAGAGHHGLVRVHLGLGDLHGTPVAVVVVITWTQRRSLFARCARGALR